MDPLEDTLKRNSGFLTELKKMTSELREVVRSVNRRERNQNGSPPRGKRKYWTCGSEDHLQRDCRLYNAEKKRNESGNEEGSSPRGGARLLLDAKKFTKNAFLVSFKSLFFLLHNLKTVFSHRTRRSDFKNSSSDVYILFVFQTVC